MQTSALAFLVAFAAGYTSRCWQERPGPDVAQLKASRDSLAGEVLALRIRERARATRDSTRAHAAAELERRAHASLTQTVVLGATVTRLTDSLQVLLARSDIVPQVAVTDLFRQLGQAHGAEQRACIAAFSACDSALALERARITTRDSTIGEQRGLLAGYQVQLDGAIAAAGRRRPSATWLQLVRVGSCAAAGYGAAKQNAALGFGGGAICGVGFVLR